MPVEDHQVATVVRDANPAPGFNTLALLWKTQAGAKPLESSFCNSLRVQAWTRPGVLANGLVENSSQVCSTYSYTLHPKAFPQGTPPLPCFSECPCRKVLSCECEDRFLDGASCNHWLLPTDDSFKLAESS
jgi:hypothetical protein